MYVCWINLLNPIPLTIDLLLPLGLVVNVDAHIADFLGQALSLAAVRRPRFKAVTLVTGATMKMDNMTSPKVRLSILLVSSVLEWAGVGKLNRIYLESSHMAITMFINEVFLVTGELRRR